MPKLKIEHVIYRCETIHQKRFSCPSGTIDGRYSIYLIVNKLWMHFESNKKKQLKLSSNEMNKKLTKIFNVSENVES